MIIDGIKFSWSYSVTGKKKNMKRVTVCIAKNKEGNEIGVGIVMCSTKDQYIKEAGRRKSLADLLLNPDMAIPHEKVFRTKVWETYRTLTKVPRWMSASDKIFEKVAR